MTTRHARAAEKRPQRSYFGCRSLAPSDRRRIYASLGARIGGPVPERAIVALMITTRLLSWRPRCMQPAEKRPLVLPLRGERTIDYTPLAGGLLARMTP